MIADHDADIEELDRICDRMPSYGHSSREIKVYRTEQLKLMERSDPDHNNIKDLDRCCARMCAIGTTLPGYTETYRTQQLRLMGETAAHQFGRPEHVQPEYLADKPSPRSTRSYYDALADGGVPLGEIAVRRKADEAKARAPAGATDSWQVPNPASIKELRAECDKAQQEAAAWKHEAEHYEAKHDKAEEAAADWQENADTEEQEAKQLRDSIAAAREQFLAITGDFPGLTGPLVDLFRG